MTPERLNYAREVARDLGDEGKQYSAGVVRELIEFVSNRELQVPTQIPLRTDHPHSELGSVIVDGGYPHHVPHAEEAE